MGQCQFMPSTYWKYAVDADNDGRRDIWNDTDDVLASIGNYLAAIGWQRNLGWGHEVALATPIDASEIGLGLSHSLAEWAARGVTYPDGSALPQNDIEASLLQPDGVGQDGTKGAAFLAFTNIPVIMRWNHSTYFALSVGLLSDGIAGMP
jgi:membrane-bound lytic murein transglycosylase B